MPGILFQSSVLVGGVTDLIVPSILEASSTSLVAGTYPMTLDSHITDIKLVHPLALVGISGLFINALNLLPLSSSNGGRAFQAFLGRRKASLVSAVTTALIGVYGIVTGNLLDVSYLLTVIFFFPRGNPQLQDEVGDIYEERKIIASAVLLFTLLMMLPYQS